MKLIELLILSIANGSNYELQTQLLLLIELNLIKKEKVQPIIDICIEIQKMNYSFQKFAKQFDELIK